MGTDCREISWKDFPFNTAPKINTSLGRARFSIGEYKPRCGAKPTGDVSRQVSERLHISASSFRLVHMSPPTGLREGCFLNLNKGKVSLTLGLSFVMVPKVRKQGDWPFGFGR